MASVTIDLRPDTEFKLREKAAREGESLEMYIQKIAESAAVSSNGVLATDQRRPSFEDLTGPIAGAVAASGMTDEEVEGLFEEVVDEVRAERRGTQLSPP
jgi:hypothetical protein